jgi:YegS/Rv2252/BmrU family lipid kinase
MRKAALLYNPDSGGSRWRQRELQSALALFKASGIEAEMLLADSRDQGASETQRAVDAGCDTVFACGGDGTINNVAQVLANTPAALAILPMGTANALAHDLGLPMNVIAAAKAAISGKTRRVALGKVTCAGLAGAPMTRYFTVAAGIGVDAHLFYKLHSGSKQRLGMTAYYAKAWNLLWTYSMARFAAEYVETGSAGSRKVDVTELLAVRIRQFGGIVRELAPGASLDRNDVRLIVCRTDSRLRYLSYVARSLLGGSWTTPGIDLVHGTSVRCDYSSEPASRSERRVYVEADGELIGMLPAEITIVPNALTLLAPSR